MMLCGKKEKFFQQNNEKSSTNLHANIVF